MIFLPNKNKKHKHHHQNLSSEYAAQIQMANHYQKQQQQQQSNLSRQQVAELRRQQTTLNEQKKREKIKDTLLKVLAFTGSIFLLAGVSLLIYGIVQSQMFGYVSGGILLGAGIILLGIMAVIMCMSSLGSEENYEMTGSNFSTRSQVTPNY